jgi:hypothetical protein
MLRTQLTPRYETANQHDYIHLKTRLIALVLLEGATSLPCDFWCMAAVHMKSMPLRCSRVRQYPDHPIAEDAGELTNGAKQTANEWS